MEKENRLTKSINNLIDLINETEWYKPIAIIVLLVFSPVIAVVQFIIRFITETIEDVGNFYESFRRKKDE